MRTMIKSSCPWIGFLVALMACQSPAVVPAPDAGDAGADTDADNDTEADIDADADAGFGDLLEALPEDCESDDALPNSCEELGYTFGGRLLYTRDCRVDERRCRQFVSIAAGEAHVCAVLADGHVLCWGNNEFGQLGNGANSYEPVPRPQEVVGLTGVVKVACEVHRTCAVTGEGLVYCWGLNSGGVLGTGTSAVAEYAPVLVPELTDVVDLTLGSIHSCVVLRDGTARCWGDNGVGELGDSSRDDSSTPVRVTGITTAVSIDAGSSHTCLILADKTVKCWGRNVTGTLGDGSTTERPWPVIARYLFGVVAVSVWEKNNLALLEDGRVYGWGGCNEVMVPEEYEGYVTIPLENPYVHDAVGVATGWMHACTLQVDGTVACWGRGSEGQLGEAGMTGSRTPVPIAGVSAAGMIASGRSHICALVQQGKKIFCWGLNHYGQLGLNFTGWQHSAVPLEIIP